MVRAEPTNNRTAGTDTNHSTMFTLLLELNLICEQRCLNCKIVPLRQWFLTCGTRTTSGTRRSSRWYASTFCLLLNRREFLVQVGLILSFLEPSTLSRSVIPKLCAATDSQVFHEAFWKKTI